VLRWATLQLPLVAAPKEVIHQMLVLAPAGLRLGTTLIASVLLHHAHSWTECSVTTPAGAWPHAVAYKAVQSGVSKITVPSKQEGYNRTMRLQGFCHNALFAAKAFTCDTTATGEKRLNAKPNPGLEIKLAETQRCELSAISLVKVGDGAEIQFRFETCDAGVPPSVVVLPMKKAETHSSMLPWVKEVCEETLPDTELTPEENSVISVAKNLQVLPINVNGNDGPCKGELLSQAQAAADQDACQSLCFSSLGLQDATGDCSGFAFNEKAEAGQRCNLYKGTWTGVDITAEGAKDWKCFSMSLVEAGVDTLTEAPDPLLAEADLESHVELKVAEAMGGPPPSMETAQLRAIAPPEDNPGCFGASMWFSLEDTAGTLGSFPVNVADWDELMAMIPEPMSAPESAPGVMIMDRFLVVSDCSEMENPKIATWGKACPAIPEKGWEFKLSVPCRIFEIINAVLTGIITPIAAWVAVRMGYNYLKPAYKKPNDLIDPCSIPILGILCGVAVGAALITAIIVSQLCNLIGLIFGCAAPFLEISILTSAAFFAASFAIIVGLTYLFLSHPKGQSVSKKKDKTYLVMEVEEGENGSFATPVYMETNPMASKAGSESVLMSSHMGTGQMRSIMLTS